MTDNILRNRILKELAKISEQGTLRKLCVPSGIDFSSNDYLCLAKDERLKKALINGVKKEGIGSTASRLLRGQRNCFSRVEKQFANWKGTEGALYFSTGYQANIGLMQTFLGENDVVFSDELNHASLIDGIRLSKAKKVIFSHCGTESLEDLINSTRTNGQKFLVTESLFSMDGDVAPLERYAQICRNTNTNLIIDEAHAVGLYGKRGSGLIEEFGIDDDVFLSVNTAGKALGVSGAFVAGDNLTIDYLVNKCRSFIFSTAPLPAIADALITAIAIIESESDRRNLLKKICRNFNNLLSENGFDAPDTATEIIPIVIGDSDEAVRVAKKMQDHGFDVRAIRPPTVAEGTSRLRISLNVNLTEEILKEFIGKLREEI